MAKMMIKAGMDSKKMKAIAANNMKLAGKKPYPVKGTKYKKVVNDHDADDMKMKKKSSAAQFDSNRKAENKPLGVNMMKKKKK